MNNNWIYLIPIIGTITGWLINSLIIRVMLYPANPVKIGGLTFQGFLFKKLQVITAGIGNWANQNFISTETISKKLTSPEAIQKLVPVVEEQIDYFLKTKLAEKMPMISMFIGEKTTGQIKTILVEEIESLFPFLINRFLENAVSDLNIGKLIEEKLNGISHENLQSMILKSVKKEIGIFKITGAIAGFIIGLIELIFLFIV
jgi:uncharacterized membrane protein YheB (UPF0754 family)